MKKKLLALVLTMVLVAALFVPAVFTSAEVEGKVVIEFGELGLVPGTGVNYVSVPVQIKENTTNIAAGKFVIVSDQGLPSYFAENGTIKDSYKPPIGAEKEYGFDYTFGTNEEMTPTANTYYDGAYANIIVTSNYDKDGVKTTGNVGTIYFTLPEGKTDVEGLTFSLGFEAVSATQVTTQEGTHPTVELYTEVPPTQECQHPSTHLVTTSESSCTVAGSADVVCDECQETIGTQALPLADHEYSVYVETVAPSCADGGYDVYKCANCEATTHMNETAALEHNYTEFVKTVEATCTAGGYDEYKCATCELTTKKNETAALNHDFSVFVENVAADCGHGGYDTYKCSRCTETTKKNEVAATGHVYSVFVKTVEATCTAGGYDEYKCATCELTTKKNEVAATGHNFVKGETVAATCTTDGYTVYACSCGETENRDTVKALGHDFSVKGETVAATETEDGYTVYKCSREGCTETEKKDIVPATGSKTSPTTADTFNSVACVLAALVAVAGAVVVGKKRFAL